MKNLFFFFFFAALSLFGGSATAQQRQQQVTVFNSVLGFGTPDTTNSQIFWETGMSRFSTRTGLGAGVRVGATSSDLLIGLEVDQTTSRITETNRRRSSIRIDFGSYIAAQIRLGDGGLLYPSISLGPVIGLMTSNNNRNGRRSYISYGIDWRPQATRFAGAGWEMFQPGTIRFRIQINIPQQNNRRR